MNTEKLIKLQSFIKENSLEDDALVEEIMRIDVDSSKRLKSYWESINNKFFKRTFDKCVVFVHVSSVKILSEENIVYVHEDRYRFNIKDGIHLDCETNYDVSHSFGMHSYDAYEEITKKEYNEAIRKIKDLVKQSENVFKQIK